MSEAIDNTGLFWRKTDDGDEEDEDIWDDSLLIDAYDRAVQSIRNEISNTSSVAVAVENKPTRNKKKSQAGWWSVGDKCLALYAGDGLYYDAVVLMVKPKQRMATIRFEEYGDEADVSFADLLPWEMRTEMTPADQEHSEPTAGDHQQIKNVGQDVNATFSTNALQESFEWSRGDMCLAPNRRTGKYRQAVVNRISDGSCKLTCIKTGEQLDVPIANLQPINDGDATERSSEDSASERDELAANPPRNANDIGDTKHKPCENPTSHTSHATDMPTSSHRSEQALPNSSHYAPRQPSGLCSSCQHQPMPSAFRAFQAHSDHRHTSPPVIPPPPVLPGDLVQDGMEESLANMLMAWYMSGYHTGYYQASSHSSNANQSQPNLYAGQRQQTCQPSHGCDPHHQPQQHISCNGKAGPCRSNSISN